MPIIITSSLPSGIAGGAYSSPIVAQKNNLDIQVSRIGPGNLDDGVGVDDQGNVNWDDTIVLDYSIENIGDDDIDGLVVSLGTIFPGTGVTANVTGVPPSNIEPGATASFQITITLATSVEWSVGIVITSDADSPKDVYTFDITGVSVDALFGDPIFQVITPGVSQFNFPSASTQRLDQDVVFNDGVVVSPASIDDLVANSEWAIDLARGTTAVYQTRDTTTPAAADGDPIYSIYPEKTPTGSTAIKLLDSNGSTHGTYKDAVGYAIGGAPVIALVNNTDGLYYPADVSHVQQTDNSNWIATNKWWFAWCIRVRDGSDSTIRTVIRADGVPRVYVGYRQDESGSTQFLLYEDTTGGLVSGPNSAFTRDAAGIKFYGAAYWDGTKFHYWGNTTTRTDQTPGAPLTLAALNTTSPMMFGLSSTQPVDIQAWYQGDQDGSNISNHIAQLQELVENFAAR